jgi:arylsulfotransferase ASST
VPSLRSLVVPTGALLTLLIAAGCGQDDSPASAQIVTSEASRARTAAAPLASRSDLRPPVPTIRRSGSGLAPGLIFITPKKVFGAKAVPGAQGGPEIIDSKGHVRYFRPNRGKNVANDFRVQQYQGKPVLTYWYGRQIKGSGEGYGVIEDEHYHRIATVRAGNGLRADFHEFTLTADGTALITAYHDVTSDGKKVVEGVIQEIDVKTGKVVTEWRSLDDVPVANSYEPQGTRTSAAFDYIHLNSADIDDDGNIIVSSRHTWSLYKIQRHTGKLLWTLGGKASDFKMGDGAQTAWQHDARAEGGGVYRVFDNAAGDKGAPKLLDHSQVVRLKLDPAAKTVTLMDATKHPSGISAGTQGDSQVLPNGNLFVGWGSQGVFSEFSKDGRLLFDARVPRGNDTYRAYKSPWTGVPRERPRLAAHVKGDRVVVDASWNGSTEVAGWRVLTGATAAHLQTAGRTGWKNLETSFSVPRGSAKFAAVQALSASGKVLATSVTRHIAG